jgi:hypothetical protein
VYTLLHQVANQEQEMTPSKFTQGYNAAALGETFDAQETGDWKRGWQAFFDDETRSESVRWA